MEQAHCQAGSQTETKGQATEQKKGKPAAKERPGALTTALLAMATAAANSLPREMPLMHKQENFNPFVFKVAPKGSLQGFQNPYIEDLTNMEPCICGVNSS